MKNFNQTLISKKYDVVIIGSGVSGALSAGILAANGLDVVIIDAGSHPKFTIGESTIPRTSLMMKVLASKYNIPEIANMGHNEPGKPTANGIKRNFGFVYHNENESHNGVDVYQTIIPENKYGAESHLFRQDADAEALYIALNHGAELVQNATVESLDINPDGVRIDLGKKGLINAEYVLDGTGHNSILAKKYGLRKDSNTLEAKSRTIFTHMLNVKPYDDIHMDIEEAVGVPTPWHQGTLHHVFDGGWLWVIPFDNHEDSTNPLCSVGLTFDVNKYPMNDKAPEEEFQAFLDMFPSVKAQFDGAISVREWVKTGRLQYNSETNIGERYCILSHGAGFIDALFSRGLANTSLLVDGICQQLINAKKTNNFISLDNKKISDLQSALIDYNDKLVFMAFLSWKDHALWNMWVRIWMLGTFLDWIRLSHTYDIFTFTEDKQKLANVIPESFKGSICPGLEPYNALFENFYQTMKQFESGSISAEEAKNKLNEFLSTADWIPEELNISENKVRHFDKVLDLKDYSSIYKWFKSEEREVLSSWMEA